MNTEKYKNKRLLNKLFVCLLLVSVFALSLTVFAQNLIPCGKTVGITVTTKGVRVIDTAEFKDADGNTASPAADAGIVSGDILLSINGKDILSSTSLAELTDKFGDKKLNLVYLRGGEEKSVSVNAKNSEDGHYRLGVWIKDFESGIGTLTYINPETKEFGALGHGICYTENEISDISGGSILNAQITSVKRGERGVPGELMGIFADNSTVLGEVTENTERGIFGKANDNLLSEFSDNIVETAERYEVVEGDATVLSNVEGSEVCEYEARIVKINDDETNTKGLIIKITDKKLLEKTGGIVQGMSGSPILQNGKLVGAVTHVFVNDPTRGYGIFIENMLAEKDKIK